MPTGAALKLEGDLTAEGLLQTWNVGEIEARRRLIQFTSRQDWENITFETRFQKISPGDLNLDNKHPDANTRIISCILWEERGESFVNSADFLLVLETILGVKIQFTVEEKTRIRRNLEEFRHKTVSDVNKEFFQVLKSLPRPKPYGLQKEVKVIAWSVSPLALIKIVDKYVGFMSVGAINLNINLVQ